MLKPIYEADPNKINFVEGVGLDDDFVPEAWDAEHVGRRLVDAFAVNDRCPRVRGPRGAGNSWIAEIPQEYKPSADERSKMPSPRVAPTGLELEHMEMAFDWLRLLRQADSALASIAGQWALAIARGQSIKALCQRKSWALRTFHRKRSQALEWIVTRLEQCGIPVF
jgi:hypothetical protein